MKKIKREYTYTRDRQIWRLLPTGTGKLIIEEREMNSKEAFYNCIKVDSGEKIFYDFQLEEKHWSGIESIYDDFIFFHKFASRDMPDHKGIIAFDIASQNIIWQTDDYIFDFITNDKIFCFKNYFEGRSYYVLSCTTGKLLEDLSENFSDVNRLREEAFEQNNFDGYLFPEPFDEGNASFPPMNQIAASIKAEFSIAGKIEFIPFNEIVLHSFHQQLNNGKLNNRFRAIDILNKNIILEEILNKNSNTFIPDSFFIKDDLLFLLIEKTKLEVCSIKI